MPIFPLIPELSENVRKSPLHLGDVDLGDLGKRGLVRNPLVLENGTGLEGKKKTVIWGECLREFKDI